MSAPRTNVAIAERMDEWREKKATQESFSANDIAFCREVSAALRKEPPAQVCGCKAFALDSEGSPECAECGHKSRYHGIPGCAPPSSHPALPAEVEAVLAELRDPVMRVDTKGRKTMHRRAATLLRRYAQAIALFEQRDSERNRAARESGVTETTGWARGFDDGYDAGVKLNPVIEDVTAALKQAVAEKDAKLQAVEAWCITELKRVDAGATISKDKNNRLGYEAHRAKWNVLEAVIGKIKTLRKILREEH